MTTGAVTVRSRDDRAEWSPSTTAMLAFSISVFTPVATL